MGKIINRTETRIIYQTSEGDTFDSIALGFYNDEFQASGLMNANPRHIGTIRFGAGVELVIPIIEAAAADTVAPWMR